MNTPDRPWLDIRLSEEAIEYLWSLLDNTNQTHRSSHVSKVADTDNWFYENVLKDLANYLYCKDWNNRYDVLITKIKSLPIFK